MKDGTLKQASKVLSLFDETPGDQIQALLESGLLTDLRDGNIVEVKRDDFRKLLGLMPLSSVVTIVSTDGIIAPKGGKIHIVSALVDESRAWEDAVSAAGPNTDRDWDVWKVSDQYPPMVGATQDLQQVILVNFGKYMRSKDVLAWGKTQNLHPSSPRSVFAIGKRCPNLNRDLAIDYMAVVSLISCSFEGRRQVPSFWWFKSKRKAYLCWFDGGWYEYCWFAFVRE